MDMSQSHALTLAVALGCEYWLKQWWSDLFGQKMNRAVYSYVLYRLVHLVLLSGSGFLLFRSVGWVDWVAFSACLVILGSLELFVQLIILKIQETTGTSFYQLNYLVPLALIVFANVVDYAPRFDADYRLVVLFVLLAHPANYFIRWALNKDAGFSSDRTTSLASLIFCYGNQPYSAEVAASADTPQRLEQRARVGRRIGTIERWLILLLIVSENISSLGLVITAKSIVRYPQLADKEFAEYYLFGTLLSVVLALVSGFFVLGGL